MAALASCSERTSCCVKTMSPCGPVGEQVLEARSRGRSRARAACACRRPLASTTPAATRPASRSTTPEPQMPSGSRPPIARTSLRLAVGAERDALDRALDGLHAAGDLVALEGRARGAARDDRPRPSWTRAISVLVPMSIARRGVVDCGQARGGDHGQAVRADEAGDRRREVDAGLGVHGEAELGGAQGERRGRGRREGRSAETDGRDAPGPGGAWRCCPRRSCRRGGAARSPGARRASPAAC